MALLHASAIVCPLGGGLGTLARIREISSRGLCVEVDRSTAPTAVDALVHAVSSGSALELPGFANGRGRSVRVRWIKRPRGGSVLLGMEFTEPLAELSEVVARLGRTAKP